MDYLIVPFSSEHRAVDLWSSVRLPFEAKGWVREMRDDLRASLTRVPVLEGQVLHAHYASSEIGVFDLENVIARACVQENGGCERQDAHWS